MNSDVTYYSRLVNPEHHYSTVESVKEVDETMSRKFKKFLLALFNKTIMIFTPIPS